MQVIFILLALLLSSCGTENSPLGNDQALLVIDMPKLKSVARALDVSGPAIPDGITDILFRVDDSDGKSAGAEQQFVLGKQLQFSLAAGRDYTVTGTAKAGEVILFAGSQTVPALSPGETRNVAISLLAQTKIAQPQDVAASATTATPAGGTFATPQSVSLACDSCSAIHFTLDGSEPTLASTKYSSPIIISGQTTLKFLGVNPAGNAGSIHTESYSIVSPPATPTITAAARDAIVTLNWAPISGTTEYRIFRGLEPGVAVGGAPLAIVSTANYTDATVKNGTTYYYRVAAANQAGAGSPSAEVSAKPLPPIPGTPSNLDAAPGDSQIDLTWTPAANATEYRVYRGISTGVPTDGVPVGTVTTNLFKSIGLSNGTSYFFKVVAVNAAGIGPTSSEVNAKPLPQLPDTPANLTATTEDRQVSLSWAAVNGATEYRIYRNSAPGVSTLGSAHANVSTTHYTDLGLSNGATYYYRVVAANLAGSGPGSSEVDAKPQPAVPSSPTGLKATANDGKILLNWNRVNGLVEYLVFRASSAGVSTVDNPVYSGTETSITDLLVSNGTTYYYRVVAKNLGGQSTDSEEVSAKPLPPLPPAATNLVATAGNAQVNLSWTAALGATEYRIYRNTVAGAAQTGVLIATVSSTSFPDQGRTNGTTYFYNVIATNQAGDGPAANEVSAKPLPGLPAAPANLNATPRDGQVDLTWSTVDGATEYQIFQGTAPNVNTKGNPAIRVATPNYSVSGLTNGTTYYFVVVATNLAGPGLASREVSAKPLPPIPTAPENISAAVGDGQIILSWSVATAATQYRVFRSTSPIVSTTGTPIGTSNGSTFTSVGLTNGAVYYFKVVATNVAGNSPESAEISATPLPLKPAVPTIFTANAANAQVALSWSAVAGASDYRVFRGTAPGVSTTGSPLATVTNPSHADLTVINGTTYYYKVMATNLAGNGPATGEISAKPLPLAPDSPANLAAVAGNTQITLTWTAVIGATEYRVFRGTAPGVSAVGTAFTTTTNVNYADKSLTNGTVYYYKVVAANLAGPGAASVEVNAKPLPPLPAAPTNVTATASDTKVVLGWLAVSGATEYRVFRGTSVGVATTGTPYATTSATSYSDSIVNNGTTYYYAIVAANLAGPGIASAEVIAKPLPPLPAAPTNLTAVAGNAEIVLNWAAVNGATEYKIYSATFTGVSTTGVAIGKVTTPGFTSIALTNGATYFFRVVAINLAGPGADSAEVSAKPLPPLPAAPSNLVAAPSDGHADLSWGVVAFATEYRIFRGTTAGVSTTGAPLTVVYKNSYSDVGLTNGSAYFYKVLAANIAGAGPASAEVNARPLPLLPSAPTSFTVTAGDKQATLSWAAIAGTTGYRVFRGTSSGVSVEGNNPIATLPGTSYGDSGLTNGTTYFYKVVADNVAGPSPASDEMSATPLPPLPPAPTNLAVMNGDALVTLSWLAAANASDYRVYRSTSPSAVTTGTLITTVTALSYTNLALTNGATYYYAVVATNLAGAGSASNEVTAKPLPPLPVAPTNVTAIVGDGQIALTWSAVNGATGYNIFSGTSAGVSIAGVPVGTVTAPSFTRIGLTNGTTYYFKVVATNVAGSSPGSTEVIAKPLPPVPVAPASLTANPGDTQITLAWAAVAGASNYQVFRGTAPGVVASGTPLTTVTNATYVDMTLINGTIYYYKVVAVNLAGPGAASLEVNAKPLPPLPLAPTNFSATAGNTQVALAWTAVSGATAYRVFRDTKPNVSTVSTQFTQVGVAAFTDLGLTNGTTYYYAVVAVNLAGPGAGSSEVSARPLPPKPAAPTGFTATAGDTKITLVWSAVSGATEYRVFHGTSPNVLTSGSPVTTVATPSFTDTGLTNGTTYYFKVVAANMAGAGDASPEISKTPLPPLPAVPTNLIAAAGNAQVALTWTAVTGVTEYRIYRGTSAGVSTTGAAIAVSTVTTPSFTNLSLTNGTTYFFKVVAANMAGPGPESAEVNAKPLPPKPGEPTNLTATAGDKQVVLAWTAVTGATDYQIFRSTSAGVVTSGTPLATVITPPFTSTGLVNGTPYYFKVVATNVAGPGPASTEVTTTPTPPLPAAPANLTAVAGDAQVTLSWQAAANAAEYRIYRSTSPGAVTTGILVTTVTGISYTNLALTNGTTYYFAVIATNLAGAGPASNEVIAKPLPPLPVAPLGVTATASDSQVALTWTAVNGATGYNIFSGTSASVSTAGTPVGTVTALSFTRIGLTNGTTYYFKVVATNVAGSSPGSTEVSAMPLPPVPAAPTTFAATPGDAQVALSWAEVAGATEYRLFRGTTSGVVTSGTPLVTVPNTKHTDLTLKNGTIYYYKVVAANLAGPGTASVEVAATPLPPVPVAPTNFSATAGDKQAILAWTAVTGATDYKIFRSTNAGVDTSLPALASVTTPSFTSTDLVNGIPYFFKVVATNIAGAGPASTEVTTTPLPALPAAPANLTAVAGDAQVTLSWEAATNAVEYRIYRGTSPSAVTTGAVIDTIKGTAYTNLKLNNGTTYYYAVIAANLAGDGPASNEVIAKPLPPVPVAPANVTVTAGDSQVALTWVTVDYATTYKIFSGTSPDVSTAGKPVGTVTAPSFTSIGLTNGTTYYFKVVATNVAGSSPGSTEVSAMPLPPVPAAPTTFAATPGDAQVALSWAEVAGATEYRLFRGTTSGVVTSGTPLVTVPNTKHTDLTLKNGTIYYYKVVAANLAGPGTASVEVAATPLPPVPVAPTNFSATAGDKQAILAWTAVTGATDYKIFRSTNAGVDTSLPALASVTTPSFTSTDLVNGIPYFFKVVATNIAGAGPASTEVTTTPLPALPAAPANLTAVAGDAQVTLSWEAATNAVEYRIYRGTSPSAVTTGAVIDTIKGTAYTNLKLNNGTTYYYAVIAANLAGDGPASNEVIAKPLPPLPDAPTNVTAAAGDGKIELTWTPVSGATEYHVFGGTAADVVTTGEPIGKPTGTLFNSIGLTNGATYFFKIVAVNAAGPGPTSAEVSATPLTVLPPAPTNFTATPGDAQVTLAWTAVADATEYRIYRDTATGVVASGTPFATEPTATYQDAAAINGTTYFYKVVAVNLAGPGPASAEVSAKPLPPLPAAATNLIATAGDSQISLTWSAVNGATEYRVFRGTSAGVDTTGTPIGTLAGTSFNSIGLTNGTTYFFKVVAVNVAGSGPASAEVSAQPLPSLPSAPTEVTATAGDTQIDLAWTTVAGATEYRVYRGTTAGVSTADLALTTVTSPSYTDLALTNGTTYYYKVVAANLAGLSPASAEVNAKPLPPLPGVPTSLSATAGDAQVTLLWLAVAGATEYHIFRSTTSGVLTTGTPLDTVTTNTYTYTDAALTNGTIYYYKVVAANLAGPGVASAEVSAKPLPPLPAAPTNVTTTPDNQSVTLTWSAVAGATEYNVYRGTAPNVPAIGVPFAAAVKSAPFIDNKVTNNTTYYYKVTAANLAGEGPASSEVNAKPGVLLSSVTLNDAGLINCLLDAVKQNGYTFVYELTNLQCSAYGIAALTGVEQLTGLAILNLHDNPSIQDITPLGKLPDLRELDLSLGQLTQVPDLTGWPALERLVLSNNLIADIGSIGTSATLRDLNLDSNPLESIHALAKWVPNKDLTLHLNGTNLVDVAALEITPNIRSASVTAAPYLSCQSVSHLDKTIDGGNGNATGIVTWDTCIDLPARFSFADKDSRQGWHQEGLGETSKFTYVSPNPLALTWEQAPVASTIDGRLKLTRTQAWPSLPSKLWFNDLVSPDLTNEANWQAMTDLSIRAVSSQYKGNLKVQFLLDVTTKKDGAKSILWEIDTGGDAVFHTISAKNLSPINGSFGAVSNKYIINNIRLRIHGDTPTGGLILNVDDIIARVLQ